LAMRVLKKNCSLTALARLRSLKAHLFNFRCLLTLYLSLFARYLLPLLPLWPF
jgi:hypothetical protein